MSCLNSGYELNRKAKEHLLCEADKKVVLECYSFQSLFIYIYATEKDKNVRRRTRRNIFKALLF